jgi:hypothetical protein
MSERRSDAVAVSPRSVPRVAAPWTLAVLVVLALPIALYGLAFPFLPDANPEFHRRLMTLP